MAFHLEHIDLDKLNTLTKYPSIPTYHPLDPKTGALTEGPIEFSKPVVLTEKVDGTNVRIVCTPDGRYVIGSRGELLFARGDLVRNPALGIVDTVRALADRIADTSPSPNIKVYYGEVYGGKVTQASRQYTGHGSTGFRLFDIVTIEEPLALLSQPSETLSRWREQGGPSFASEDGLRREADELELLLTPRLGEVEALPLSIESANVFLHEWLPRTRTALDEQAGGRPEGIVLRMRDRSLIAKMRFADYRRTLSRRR